MYAVTYARCSTGKQEASIEQQEEEFRAWAGKCGASLKEQYRDDGISGVTATRPAFRALMAAVEARTDFQTVLVYDRSRWGRFADPKESVYWEWKISRAGKALVALHGNNGTDLAGDIMRLIESHEAGEYSRKLSALVRRGSRDNARRGFWNGGRAPYGYRRELVDPATGEAQGRLEPGQAKAVKGWKVRLVLGPAREQAAVRLAFRLDEKGRPLRAIVRAVRAVDDSRDWTKQDVHRILRNPVYLGDLVWKDRGGRYETEDENEESAARSAVERIVQCHDQKQLRK